MVSTEYTAVTDLGRGVVALTALGRPSEVATDRIRHDAARIEQAAVTAVVYTPRGHGQTVLAAPTGTVLLRADTVDRLGTELLTDVGGAHRFQDPVTALLDVQWRLTLLGHDVVAEEGPAPRGWVPGTTSAQIQRLRGLLTMFDTNLAMPLRGHLLPLLQLLAVSVPLARSGTDTTALDLQRSPGGDDIGTITVPTSGLAGAWAVDGALDDLPDTTGVREYVQDIRRAPDRALLPLIRQALPDLLSATGADGVEIERMTHDLALDDVLGEPLHVLFVAPEEGPARSRCDAVSTRLGEQALVRVTTTPHETTTEGPNAVPGWIHEQTAWADVIVLVGTTLDDAPGAWFSSVPIAADLSTFDIPGWLMTGPRTKYRAQALDELMRRADFVLAADQVQRDILLGALAGTERVNAAVYDDDPSLTSLVTVDATGDALVRFCLRPIRSADAAEDDVPPRPHKPNDLVLAVRYLKEGGVQEVAQRAMGRIRRQRLGADDNKREA
ncbi:hypothetical protein [Actinomyces sp.]|uniref:hypothetical protein n=1 Tax=Actinomyces sp. TaxID=29317 RepID=UPI00289AE49A|nr:hypothetical protein [Actinomyces sp.]